MLGRNVRLFSIIVMCSAQIIAGSAHLRRFPSMRIRT